MSILTTAIRKQGGGKWHRGGRFDYPGDLHCPTGLSLVLMPRGTESKPLRFVPHDERCRRCFPPWLVGR